jgi:apolipoprotein N-acyltransferase
LKVVRGKKILLLIWPFVASAVMLTVIQPPIDLSALAWVSLVPFVLACTPAARPKSLALAGYLVSLAYWLGNLYWVFPVTIVGWAAFCLYTAVLWPVLALALRYCRIKKLPLFLAVPVLVVAVERLQGLFLGGFFWRFLAHSQYANITIIQIADIFGAAGVSFLIAMVNGLLAELIIAARDKQLLRIAQLAKIAPVCIAVAASILYGRWRISQSKEFIDAGPLVASLQSNVPQSVKRAGLKAEAERAEKTSMEIFDDLMTSSEAGATAGAELIVWPETMAQAILDADVYAFLNTEERSRTFDARLRQHSTGTAYVLVGAYGGQIKEENDTLRLARYNSAFLYRPDGSLDPRRYDKIHLVPFGEFLPFRRTCPWLYDFLMKFTPFNYDYSLDAGSEEVVFRMTSPVASPTGGPETRTYRFSVMICYEDSVPAIARRFALDERGKKQVDWLVNISNDGWFVLFDEQTVSPTAELPQHAAICAFRAVENRLAIIRSVNTGISCLIDSVGRIRDGYIEASPDWPVAAMQRQAMPGWFATQMPIDRRVTFFSKNGQWLDFCCVLCLFSLIILPLWAKLSEIRTITSRNRKRS